jgi:two-component SAPR family response regulator
MSELNGIELIRKVNEIKPSIKALLMSAFECKIYEEKYHKRILAKANSFKRSAR